MRRTSRLGLVIVGLLGVASPASGASTHATEQASPADEKRKQLLEKLGLDKKKD